ncbi:MAG: caspase family protein [Planctomycetes bacterium]|nr:caspase family protein [Planctomycetota bacterium]
MTGAYEQFFETSRRQDRIVFYFGGHALEVAGKPYLAPVEADPEDLETLIPLADFYEKLKACKATQKVVIWDVCRFNPQRGRQLPGSGPMTQSLHDALAAAPEGVEVVIACKPGENALEFFNLQVEAGAGASAPKYAGSALLESMKYVAAKSPEREAPTPADPIAMRDWTSAVSRRVATMADTPTVALKQTVTLHGKMKQEQTPPDPEEAPAKRFAFPTPPKLEALAIVNNAVVEFRVPSIKLDVIGPDLTVLPFREAVMKNYQDGITTQEALNDRQKYKFQARTLEVTEKVRRMWTVFPGGAGGPQFRDDFKGPVNDALKTAIKKEQDFFAIGIAELELLNAELDMLADQRKDQSKRWQAHYDYARASVKARLAYMCEYNKLMGEILTETLPALDAKFGQDTYKLASSERMKSKKDVQAIAEESRKLFDQLIAEHKGTPWAVQAKREKAFSLGLMWVPISSGAGTTP